MNRSGRKAGRERTGRRRELGFLGVRRISKRVLDGGKTKRNVSEAGK